MHTFSNRAKWIGYYDTYGEEPNADALCPAIQLRKTFTLGTFQNAECLICGLGFFTLYINGKKVNGDVLSPAFTDYSKRALFLRYDVGRYLTNGENVIAVKLGNGFFNQTSATDWKFERAPWRNNPRLYFELFIDEKSYLVSDESWKFSLDGATVNTNVRKGEYYDARKEDGWKYLSYDDSSWQWANILHPIGGALEEQVMPCERECAAYKPVRVWESKNGKVYDFGKNIAGYVRLKMQAPCGETAIIRYAEQLDGKEIDQSNINCYVYPHEDFSQDRYTFKGEGMEEWNPEFVFHGFQFVEISGLSTLPPDDAVTAIFVHTDLQQTGDFSCSDSLFNWIYEAGVRSFLSCYQGFPQDCPHREKNGWTGDMATSSEYACKLFDMKQAAKKWLQDICDTQLNSGQLCGIAPTSGWGYHWGSGPAWDYALFVLPKYLYEFTGDTECMSLVYPYAKKYLDYAQYYEKDGGLVRFGLGDWATPDLCIPEGVEFSDARIIDNRLSDSCHYYSMLCIMQTMADVLGFQEDIQTYSKRASRVKNAIHDAYIHGDVVDNDGQGAMAEVLHFNVVEGEQAQAIATRLAKRLEEDNYQHKVGFVCLNALLGALSKYGYSDVLYKSIARYDYPSFGYWKNLGATSLWEKWSGQDSRNHHMYGSVLSWFVSGVAGIQNTGIAYDTCTLKPLFFHDTCFASAKVQTPRGELSFSWQKQPDKFTATIVIPTGTNATLILPNGHTRYVTNSETVEISL